PHSRECVSSPHRKGAAGMITSVARTSWLNLRRDRAAMILSFVVPLVFFSIFAGIFGGQRDSTSKVHVAVADEDRSPESQKLIDALARESSLDVRRGPDPKQPAIRFDAKSVEEYVRKGSAPAAIVIPKGYGAAPFQFGDASKAP